MSNYKFTLTKEFVKQLFLILLIVVIYSITVIIGGDKLDFWGATIFYYNWVDEISKLDNGFIYIFETYNLTLKEISAPEPVPGFLIYFLTRFIDSSLNVFHFINVLLLIFMVNLIKKTSKEKIIFLLMFIAITTGYYEFVLLHMTHRFKIAILFFVISIYYFNKKKTISEIFFVLSLLSHFSLITVLPILYFFKKLGLKIIPRLSLKKLTLTSLIILISYLLTPNALMINNRSSAYATTIDFIIYLWGSKFKQLNVEFSNLFFENDILLYVLAFLLFIIIGLFIFVVFKISLIFLKKIKGFDTYSWLGVFFIYLVFSLSLIGTNRLLQVYYLVVLIIFLANYSLLTKNKRIIFFYLFSPLFFYNFINGFYKGPISIVLNQIF